MSRKSLVPIQLPADPTLALEAVTKQYCDARAIGGAYCYATFPTQNFTNGVVVTVNVPGLASGFVRSGTTDLMCQVAGRYEVNAHFTTLNTGGAYVVPTVSHRRGGSVIRTQASVFKSGGWSEGFVTCVFDLLVGDVVNATLDSDGTSNQLEARSAITIIPVGGAKGDTGPAGVQDPPFVRYRYGSNFPMAATSVVNIPMNTLYEKSTNPNPDTTMVSDGTGIKVLVDGYYSVVGVLTAHNTPPPGGSFVAVKVGANVVARTFVETQAYSSGEVVWQGWLTANSVIYLACYGSAAYTWNVAAAPGGTDPVAPALFVSKLGAGPVGPQGPQGPGMAAPAYGEAYNGTDLNYAEFGHTSRKGGNNYAFLAEAAGYTMVNAKTGQAVAIRENNADHMRIGGGDNVLAVSPLLWASPAAFGNQGNGYGHQVPGLTQIGGGINGVVPAGARLYWLMASTVLTVPGTNWFDLSWSTALSGLVIASAICGDLVGPAVYCTSNYLTTGFRVNLTAAHSGAYRCNWWCLGW